MSLRRRALVAGALVLGAAVLLIAGLPPARVYTPAGLLREPPADGAVVQARGLVQNYDALNATFDLAEGESRVPVAWSGPVPEGFGEGREVIVDGTFDAGPPPRLLATRVTVGHAR